MKKRIALKQRNRKRQRGFTLAEMLVAMAIFTTLTVAMIAFYNSASVEFEAAAARIATNQHGRIALDKVALSVATAVPRTPTNDAFYSPDSTSTNLVTPYGMGEYVELDFISNANLLEDTSVAGGEIVYAFDKFAPPLTAPGGYVTLYRYRLGWVDQFSKNSAGAVVPGIPPNAVYLERLQRDLAPPSSRLPNTAPRILMRDVFSCRFRRTSLSTMQIRVQVYGEDPNTGKLLDGTLARNLQRHRRNTLFDITSAVPIPALTLLPTQ